MFCGLASLFVGNETLSDKLDSAAYSTVFRVTYGINVDSDEDGLVSLFGETTNRIVQEGSPGFTLIDLFPLRQLCLAISSGDSAHNQYSEICAFMYLDTEPCTTWRIGVATTCDHRSTGAP